MSMLPWLTVQNDLGFLNSWLLKNNLILENNFSFHNVGNKTIIRPKLIEDLVYVDINESAPRYVKEYSKIDAYSNFSFKFYNHSLVQCFYTFDGSELVGQKFGFFECPKLLDSISLDDYKSELADSSVGE